MRARPPPHGPRSEPLTHPPPSPARRSLAGPRAIVFCPRFGPGGHTVAPKRAGLWISLGPLLAQPGTCPQARGRGESCCLRALVKTGPRPTGLGSTQHRAAIEKKALVHSRRPALLLLLFFYKDFKEQPRDNTRAPATLEKRAWIKRGGRRGVADAAWWAERGPGRLPLICYKIYSFKRIFIKRWGLFEFRNGDGGGPVRNPGDKTGTTGRLSTGRGGRRRLSPLQGQRRQGVVHRVALDARARASWEKGSYPQTGPPPTTTTMFL